MSRYTAEQAKAELGRLPEPPRRWRLETRREIDDFCRERARTLAALYAAERANRQLTFEDAA